MVLTAHWTLTMRNVLIPVKRTLRIPVVGVQSCLVSHSFLPRSLPPHSLPIRSLPPPESLRHPEVEDKRRPLRNPVLTAVIITESHIGIIPSTVSITIKGTEGEAGMESRRESDEVLTLWRVRNLAKERTLQAGHVWVDISLSSRQTICPTLMEIASTFNTSRVTSLERSV